MSVTTERIFYADCWYVVDYSFTEERMNFFAYKIFGMDEDKIEESEISPTSDLHGYIPWDICPFIECSTLWMNQDFRSQFNKVIDHIIKRAEDYFENEF